MSETLKPCPFCGRTNAKCHVYQDAEDSCTTVVICGCGVRGSDYESPMGSRAEAIAAWNLRAPSPAFEAMRKALRAFLDEWPKVQEKVNGAIAFQSIHGIPYDGPQLIGELKDLRAALALADAEQGGK